MSNDLSPDVMLANLRALLARENKWAHDDGELEDERFQYIASLRWAIDKLSVPPKDIQRIAILELGLRTVMQEIEGVGIGCSKDFHRMALDSAHSIAERALKQQPELTPEEITEPIAALIGTAYGFLWHVNNEPGTPAQYSPQKAAMQARHLLRDMLTSEQRGFYINVVRERLQREAPKQPVPEPRPSHPFTPDRDGGMGVCIKCGSGPQFHETGDAQ